MKEKDIPRAINQVLSGDKTLHAAAKDIGVTSSSLRYWIMKNPLTAQAYKEAQAADPRRRPLKVDKLRVEDLIHHPAVQAVVNEGHTYASAAEKHGVNLVTLHGWVKKLFPDGIGRKPGARECELPIDYSVSGVQPAISAAAVLTPITASIQAAATVLGLTYHQVLAKLLEQAPTQASTNPTHAAQPVAPDNSL